MLSDRQTKAVGGLGKSESVSVLQLSLDPESMKTYRAVLGDSLSLAASLKLLHSTGSRTGPDLATDAEAALSDSHKITRIQAHTIKEPHGDDSKNRKCDTQSLRVWLDLSPDLLSGCELTSHTTGDIRMTI